MRFDFGNAGDAQTQSLVLEGWQESPALGKKQTQSYGLLVSCLGMALVAVVLHGAFVPSGLLPTLLILVLTMPVHELAHAVSTPHLGLSARTVIGVQKGKGLLMPYVVYDGEQRLGRFLLTGAAPTVLLTVLPIAIVLSVPLSSVTRTGLGFLSFFNMAISGGDLLLLTWLATRLPLGVRVRQNGWKLYYRPA